MRLSACLILLAIAGCTRAADRAPSLMPRAIESRSDAVVTEPAKPVEPDPALDAYVARLTAALNATAESFTREAQRAESLVRAVNHTGIGSEPWLDAQTALAKLDGLRAESVATGADIDRLAIARGVDGKPLYATLEALRQRASEQIADQSARIDSLQAALPGS